MKHMIEAVRLRHALLFFALAELVIWFLVKGESSFVYLSLPLCAVLFGLYLIVHVLEKETALYDEQNKVASKVRSRRPD